MTEHGTRTPARRLHDAATKGYAEAITKTELIESSADIGMTAMMRAEEIASDVRALAATVAEQADEIASLKRKLIHTESWMASYDDAKSEIIDRLAALERGQGTLSQSVQSLDRDHVGLKGRMDEFICQVYVDLTERIEAMEYQRDRAEADADDLEQIRSRVLPQSPGSAEAAPEPGSFGGWNEYQEWIDQGKQEPPALDPVVGKIVDLYLTLYPKWNPGPSDMIERGLRDEFARRTGIGGGLIPIDAAIRAYGGAREGGK